MLEIGDLLVGILVEKVNMQMFFSRRVQLRVWCRLHPVALICSLWPRAILSEQLCSGKGPGKGRALKGPQIY